MLSDLCFVSVPEIPCRTSEQTRHGDSFGAAAALPRGEGETHGWHGPGTYVYSSVYSTVLLLNGI